MLSATFAALVSAIVTREAVAQSRPAADPYFPRRIAVGMRAGTPLAPLAVEATSSGWVVVSPLFATPAVGTPLPTNRLIVESGDVRRWTKQVRALIATAGTDSSMRGMRRASLGDGRYRLEAQVSARTDPKAPTRVEASLAFYACGPGAMPQSTPIGEVAQFLALLDSAAKVAGTTTRAPTLARAYTSGEVSCAVTPRGLNVMPVSETSALADVGAQFIVDTVGRVEPGSIAFLPNADSAAVRLARAAIAGWNFFPADIDGTPVRQLVQVPITFAAPPKLAPGQSGYFAEATDDGWVHFFLKQNYSAVRINDWLLPDSVDAFVSRVRAINREIDALPSDTTANINRMTVLGGAYGASLSASMSRHGKTVTSSAMLLACNNNYGEGGRGVGDAAMFADAARAARTRRTPPAMPANGVFSASETGCPAVVEWANTTHAIYGGGVWSYPVAVYPASFRATHVRTELLASFVVDTLGRVDVGTIVTMAGADSRAVAALPATLANWVYRPGARGGMKVKQRVIQVIRFEPPPECTTRGANPLCPRKYSDR